MRGKDAFLGIRSMRCKCNRATGKSHIMIVDRSPHLLSLLHHWTTYEGCFWDKVKYKVQQSKTFQPCKLSQYLLGNFLPRHCLLRNFLRSIWSSLSASEVGDFTQQCLLPPLTLLPSLFEHCTADRLPWDALFRRERGHP